MDGEEKARGLVGLSALIDECAINVTNGYLTPLRTRAEVRHQDETVDVYVAEVHRKDANLITTAIRTLPNINAISLGHLRRVAHTKELPKSRRPSGGIVQPHVPFVERRRGSQSNYEEDFRQILLCPTSLTSYEALEQTIVSAVPTLAAAKPVDVSYISYLNLRILPVPRHAPTSPAHAKALSKAYWPSIYQNTNPFGPHPSVFANASAQLDQVIEGTTVSQASFFMALATEAARQSYAKDMGKPVGVTIVERTGSDVQVVVVAGDARFRRLGSKRPKKSKRNQARGFSDGDGNPCSHALLRAIAMVASKRRRAAAELSCKEPVSYPGSIYNELPATTIERNFHKQDNLKPGGYLCLNLEAYLTHEPCTMCSMALVHSRFGKVVFGHPQPSSGGLSASGEERGIDYGLWYREDLNWRFLCWHWLPGNPVERGSQSPSPQPESHQSVQSSDDECIGVATLV